MSLLRLDKILANLGYGSRKEVTSLIKRGHIEIDGRVHDKPAEKFDPESCEILFDGQVLDPLPPMTLALNKPVGLVCDNILDQPSIYECLPFRWRMRTPGLKCAGRLDKDSRGLVILSENGSLVHKITTPRKEISKIYRITTEAPLKQDDITLFESGDMMLKGEKKPLLPVRVIKISQTLYDLELNEGRHRQIRRMIRSRGNDVLDLKRTHVAALSLETLNLDEGAYRQIEETQIL